MIPAQRPYPTALTQRKPERASVFLITGEYLPKFKKIIPHDYKKMMSAIASMERGGGDQAQTEAFIRSSAKQ